MDDDEREPVPPPVPAGRHRRESAEPPEDGMRPSRRALIGAGLVAASVVPNVFSVFPRGVAAFADTKGTDGAGLDVRAYGAVGDGRTDDSGAIRRAISALTDLHPEQGAGGIVRFPNGLYAVASALTIPKNVYLVGDGPIASRLLYSGDRTDTFITFGAAGDIDTFCGVQGLWIDAQSKADTAVLLYGPQEGSTLTETVATGALRTVVEVRSAGIQGGSNKFLISRCWLWTAGDEGAAGLLLGAGGGPVVVRDTTFVGTNRSADAPSRSAGVVATQSIVTLDNVNVEHFESHTYLDRTQADIRDPTGYFNRYGVRTSPASTGSTLLVSNAVFDRAETCILDEGSGITLPFARSYWNEAYTHDRRDFRRNFWEIGSVNVYESGSRQATVGYTSPGTSDTSRFKISMLQPDGWAEMASIDTDGTFGPNGSAWDGPHLRIGNYHLWIDANARLRIKNGAPQFDSDGQLVGV